MFQVPCVVLSCLQVRDEKVSSYLFFLLFLKFRLVSYGGETASGDDVHAVIKSKFGHRTVPAVFVNGMSFASPVVAYFPTDISWQPKMVK